MLSYIPMELEGRKFGIAARLGALAAAATIVATFASAGASSGMRPLTTDAGARAGVAFGSATVAGPAGSSMTVTPANALRNQAVTVSWNGFANPSSFGANLVWLYQCKANPTVLKRDCYLADSFPSSAGGNGVLNGVTLADGSGSVNFEVRNDQELPELACNESTPCSIVAFDSTADVFDENTQMPPSAVIVPIQFAKSNNDCPIPTSIDVALSGEASAAQQLYDWSARVCTGSPKLAVDYTESSSNDGRKNLLEGLVDMAVTSLGPQPSELQGVKDTESIRYAPLNLDAVVLAFNINDEFTKQPITDMTLTPRLVARLITDSQLLGFFQDPEFVALNPGHAWPSGGASQPMLRAEQNADTRILTDWMYQDANAKKLIAGQDIYRVRVMSDFRDKVYPVDNFEIASSDSTGFIPHTGELDASRRLFYRARPDGYQSPTQGYMGVISRSNAIRFNLPMAKLVNATGRAVAPDAAGLSAGYASMRVANGVREPNPFATDAAAYPLAKVDYAMFRTSVYTLEGTKKVGNPAKASAFKSFLSYAVGAGQSTLAPGYLPLPSELKNATLALIPNIKAPESPAVPSTTTSAATTTTLDFTDTTIGGETVTTFDAGNGCCTVDNGNGEVPTTSGSVSPTTTGGTPRTTPQLVTSFQAPDWVPTSGVGGSAMRLALPGLFVGGLVALLARLVLQVLPALGRLRTRALAGAS